jgi:predicted O-methyltransferase YrrM
MLRAVKAKLRRAFFRSRALRNALVPLGAWRMEQSGIRVAHLGFYHEESSFGPVQREEALLIAALVRVLRPKTIVEFGFSRGHSALNFLEAMPDDSKLFSFDIDPTARDIAADAFAGDSRFTYRHKSQANFVSDDVDGYVIDLCFIDAAHDLYLNQETWRRVLPSLAPNALVLVHDTGTWSRHRLTPTFAEYAAQRPDNWLNVDVFQPHPDEREFVNWICSQGGGWTAIHLHTEATLRHGITLLQRVGALRTTSQNAGARGPAPT